MIIVTDGGSATSIIVRLIGGLGNQLFQYAIGRRLSILRNAPLKFDVSAFGSNQLRAYALTAFNIQQAFATRAEISQLKEKSGDLRGIASRLTQRFVPYYRRSVLRESQLRPFDPNVLKAPAGVYLDGYWQSEKYFVEIKDVIRSDLTIKPEPDAWNRDMAKQIAGTESVSIHVRRGDYVTDAETSRVHGSCDLNYYDRCVCMLGEKLADLHFFVFSDDPDWVLRNLRLTHPTTHITHNDDARAYEDLRLMSLCKHNVIANSSFSWWGAWLNPNPNKVVLAPQRWFAEPRIDTRDLLPATWVRV